jgi:hypothetical protein
MINEDLKNKKKIELDIEIVISCYNENIKWLDAKDLEKYRDCITIYNKGPNKIKNSISLKNVGRESHTYLYHIINNYDNLANRTVFFQGGEPSFGYNNENKGGHLYSNYYFSDYIHSKKQLELIVTSAISSDMNYMLIRSGYNKYLNIKRPISIIPTLKENTNDYWLPQKSFKHFKTYVYNLKNKQNGILSLNDFWKKYISNNHEIPTYLFYNQGAQFSVLKEIILKNSKEYYMELLKELENDINPYQGYYMEWLWPYILNKNV